MYATLRGLPHLRGVSGWYPRASMPVPLDGDNSTGPSSDKTIVAVVPDTAALSSTGAAAAIR
jgi:hypothetical protein